jgi:hypothetical protein
MGELMQGFRVACRSLLRRPAFAATAVTLLTLTIGVAVAMFSIVDAVILKPLPYPDSGQLVTLMEAKPGITGGL